MKCVSVSDIKKKHSITKDRLPTEGTKLREVHDLFLANKGIMLHTTLEELGIRGSLATLVDFYGLDIRNFGHSRWCLVGEWFGSVYVDYLADKIKPAKVKKP